MQIKLFLLFSVIFIISCEDQELIDQNTNLKNQIIELKERIKLVEANAKNMDFLMSQLQGVKARIITNVGNIELQFFPEKAPLHCFNFITRAEGGFYDNTLFHRVIPGFMIQSGDPLTKTSDKSTYGTGGPLIAIPHEFNDISHERGILSMARTADVSAGAGSQYFIMHGSAPQVDRQYTVFGKVTKGLEVVDKIATVDKNQNDMPLNLDQVRVKRIEIYK